MTPRFGMSFRPEEVLLLNELLAALRRGADTSMLMQRIDASHVYRVIHRSAVKAGRAVQESAAKKVETDAILQRAIADLAEKPRHQPTQRFCRNGHEYNEANTANRMIAGYKVRTCKACRRNRAALKWARELKARQEAALERMAEERRVG